MSTVGIAGSLWLAEAAVIKRKYSAVSCRKNKALQLLYSLQDRYARRKQSFLCSNHRCHMYHPSVPQVERDDLQQGVGVMKKYDRSAIAYLHAGCECDTMGTANIVIQPRDAAEICNEKTGGMPHVAWCTNLYRA